MILVDTSPSLWPPMEALYSALEGEISTFKRHTQQCQEGFDLHSLYHVLMLVLPRSPLGQVESWQHLQRLAHCQPGLASPDMASRYVDWLASYLQHLSTLKERFDARVVVPLCENCPGRAQVWEWGLPGVRLPWLRSGRRVWSWRSTTTASWRLTGCWSWRSGPSSSTGLMW